MIRGADWDMTLKLMQGKKSARRQAVLRKSDLTPAFEAAKAAGYDKVSVAVESADGQHFLITARCDSDAAPSDFTPLEKWKAGRAPI